MPPPELARDVPVRDLLEGADRELVLALGVVADAPLAQGCERRPGRLLHRAPPLERDQGLDARVAALAGPDRMAVALAPLERVVLLQPCQHPLVGLLLCEPGELARLLGHPPVGADHRQRGQAVVAADVEVRLVVAGRDLQRARAEVDLDPLVRDHRHAPLDDRHDHLLADRVPVALVRRVHRHRDVGEDRRRPHRGDRDRAGPVRVRVAHVGERVVDLYVLDLEVGDGGLVEGAPVDEPVRSVEPPPLPQVHEERHHGLDVGVVHREALAVVVERGAETAELAHDRAARLLEVLPDALDERLAPELLAGGAFADELLLDDVLGRDAGMVVARLPERVEALHPVPADQHVLDRAVQRVAHVQRPGDVRRRHTDDERLVAGAVPHRPGRGPPPPRCAASAPRRPAACRAAPCGDRIGGQAATMA